MKHLKRFNENETNNPKMTFEEAKEWIKENYDEDKVAEMFDEEVASGNWIDTEQMEDEGYDNEHDYYTEYGHGEAESVIVDAIFEELKSKFDLDFDLLDDETNLYQFMREEYFCLHNL